MMHCMLQHVGSSRLPRPPDPPHKQTQVSHFQQAVSAPARTLKQRRRQSHEVSASVQPARQVRCRSQAVSAPAETARRFPDFVPAAQIAEIEELAALELASRLKRLPVSVPSLGLPIDTAFVAPATSSRIPAEPQASPVVLVPSFDSSVLEFRRLLPLLEARRRTWAIDLVGWGFTDVSFAANSQAALGPVQKREHLYAFWKEQIRDPMVLCGTSLGGTIALDFALAHPEAVERLVLVDAQGFIDGLGPMSSAPRWLATLGVQVLRSERLRQAANEMAFHDKNLATADAMRVGRLHTFSPGWLEANVAFMRSGGYSLSKRISELKPNVLVLWGRHDKILSPSYAQRFAEVLPDSKLQYLERSGHSPHLEEPAAVADIILDWLAAGLR